VDLASGTAWRRLVDHYSTQADPSFVPIDGNQLWLRSASRQTGDDLSDSGRRRTRRHTERSSERSVLSHPLVDGWELPRAEVRRLDDLLLSPRGCDPSAGRLVHRREVRQFVGMRTVGKGAH
jgi:hypothetical protein